MSLGINIAPLIGLLVTILGGGYMWYLIHIEDKKKREVIAVRLVITGLFLIFIMGLTTGRLNELFIAALLFGILLSIIVVGGLLGVGFMYVIAYLGEKKPDANKTLTSFFIGGLVAGFVLITAVTVFNLNII